MVQRGLVSIEDIKEFGQPPSIIENEYFEARALRRVSPYVTKFFIERGITANQVSILTILTGLTASTLLIFGSITLMVISYFQYLIVFNLLDDVDGEIARTTNTESARGRVLESLQLKISLSSFFICFGVGLYNRLGTSIFIPLGTCFALASWFTRSRGHIVLETINGDKKILNKDKQLFFFIKKGKKLYRLYRKYSKVIYFFSFYKIGFLFILFLEGIYPILPKYEICFIPITPASIYFIIQGLHWVCVAVITGVVTIRFLR